MCGINGFTFRDEDLILKMNRAIAHRGPDGTGVVLDEYISLGHNRLSIIDLSASANQPMKSADGNLAIVFSGEIYNFQDLKRELADSYPFRTKSDTEVILACYQRWGKGCVRKLNGIFAFAIWDFRKRELFLARDPMGVKPLYYHWDSSTNSERTKFIFSSEIKAILEHPVARAVDRDAFNLFFHVFYVPEPYTMFYGVKKLPQASMLTLRDGVVTIEKYWEADESPIRISKEDARTEILRLFQDAVRTQLVSDRPVGVFLSGGMDSTAVLGAIREAVHEPIKTFSVGFDVRTDGEKFNADFLLARKTAHHYKTDHRELVIKAEDIARILDSVSWHLDEPNFNPTAAAIFLLAREAKKDVAVVLGGDGGDELFGGYPRYYFSRLLSHYYALPVPMQAFIRRGFALTGKDGIASKLSAEDGAEKVLSFLSAKEDLLAEVLGGGLSDRAAVHSYFRARYFANDRGMSGDFEKHFMNIDRQSWLVDESLLRTDKMTMAWGLEERVPILDRRLVEFACRLPTSWKLDCWHQTPNRFQGKRIWREAVRAYLPPHVLHEKKRGWFTPMAKWFREELREVAGNALEAVHPDFFDRQGVGRVWRDHLNGTRYNLNILWAIIMWQRWHSHFIKKHG